MNNKNNILYHDIIGFILFVAIAVGITHYLQSSLIVFRQIGVYAHWGIILIVIPIFLGLLIRFLRTTFPMLVCLLAAVVVSVILFLLYRYKFWAEPPNFILIFLLAFIYFGISYSITGHVFETVFRFASKIKINIKYFRTNKPTEVEDFAEKKANNYTQKHLNEFINSPIVRLCELIVTFLSFFLAVVSTFIMGR